MCIAIRDLNYCLRMLKKDQEAVDILQQHQRAVSYHQGIHSFTYELTIILAGNFCINCAVVTFLILNEQTIQMQFALAMRGIPGTTFSVIHCTALSPSQSKLVVTETSNSASKYMHQLLISLLYLMTISYFEAIPYQQNNTKWHCQMSSSSVYATVT